MQKTCTATSIKKIHHPNIFSRKLEIKNFVKDLNKKQMKKIMLIICIGFMCKLNAQTTSVLQVKSDGIIKGAKTFVTKDGGIVTVTKNIAQVPFTITAIKLSASGKVQWQTTVTNGVSSWALDFPYVVQTADGNYIIAIIEELAVNLIKLDSKGNYLWDKSYRRSRPNDFGGDQIISIYGITPDKDTSVVMCGLYSTFSKLKGYVFKVNVTNGTPLWLKTTYSTIQTDGFSNDQDRFQAIDRTSDGAYITAGVTTNVKGIANFKQYFSVYKYDKNGNVLWAKANVADKPSSFGSTLVTDIKEVAAGNYLLAGYNNYQVNCYMGFNDTGAVLFSKRLHILPGDTTQFNLSHIAVNKKTGQNLLLGNNPNSSSKVKMFVLNKKGDLTQAGSISFDSTEIKNNESFIVLPDSTVMATGYSQHFGDGENNKLFYIKYNSKFENCLQQPDTTFTSANTGFTSANITATATDETAKLKIDSAKYSTTTAIFSNTVICTGNIPAISQSTENISTATVTNNFTAKIFPNPVTGEVLNLQTNLSLQGYWQLTIFQANGRQVSTQKMYLQSGLTNHTIAIANLENGIYFLNLSNGKESKTIRFLKYN